MGGGAPDGRTRSERVAVWHIGRQCGGQDGPHDYACTMNLGKPQIISQQILLANYEKSWDGKATELRRVFDVFATYHAMLAGLHSANREKSRDAKLMHQV